MHGFKKISVGTCYVYVDMYKLLTINKYKDVEIIPDWFYSYWMYKQTFHET